MESSVEHDSHDCVEGIGRELFRSCHEISRGIINEGVDFTELLLCLGSRGLDGSIVADIACRESGRAASAVNLVAGCTKRLFPPAGKKNGAPLQQVSLKQDAPPCPNCLDWVNCGIAILFQNRAAWRPF